MEVAPRDDVAVSRAVREYQRIVRSRVEFPLHDASAILRSVPAGAVHLGNAAQGVRVLHPLLALARGQAGALQKLPKRGGAGFLARLAPQLMDTRVVRVRDAP